MNQAQELGQGEAGEQQALLSACPGTAHEVSSDPAQNLLASQPRGSIRETCQPEPPVQTWLLTVVECTQVRVRWDCSLLFSLPYLQMCSGMQEQAEH